MLAKIEHARQAEDRTRSEFVRQAIRVYLAHTDPERRFSENGDGAPDDGTRRRAKEADGALADADVLGAEGELDRTGVGVKEPAAGRGTDKVRNAVADGKDRT